MTIERLGIADQKILRYLLSVPSQSSRIIAFHCNYSLNYVIQKLDRMHMRGILVRDKKGRSVMWGIKKSLTEEVAKSLPDATIGEQVREATIAQAEEVEKKILPVEE